MPWKNFKRFLAKLRTQPRYAIKVLQQRGRAYASYYLGRGRSSLPEAVTFFLTHRCNLRCKMCGQWGEGGVTKRMDAAAARQDMPQEQLQRWVQEVSSFKPNITLFGGEPLLHPGCVDTIRQIKSLGMHCLMITNASLLQQYAGEMVGAGLDELNVSLDGGRELHDEIRGLPGLFQTILSGLTRLNDEKIRQGRSTPLINVQCTITKYNYEHLEQLLEVGRVVQANSLTFHNLIFLRPEEMAGQRRIDEEFGCTSAAWEGFVNDPGIDPRKLADTLTATRRQSVPFGVDVYPNFSARGLADYYANPGYRPREYPGRCLSPWIVAYVFPDGSLRPCLNCSYCFGNITAESFSAAWNSPAAVRYRRALTQRQMFPACVRCTELYRY